jgi:hypothetical protein
VRSKYLSWDDTFIDSEDRPEGGIQDVSGRASIALGSDLDALLMHVISAQKKVVLTQWLGF